MTNFDSFGNKLPRGARVLVRFEKSADGAPFEWTGKVTTSKIPGRIAIKSEYVTWKGPFYFATSDEGITIRRISADEPLQYREMREFNGHSGMVVVRVLNPTVADFEWSRRVYEALGWKPGRKLIEIS